MSASQILLIVISGLGVIHGFFLAMFLWGYSKGHRLSNQILSLLLVVLSLRVGKSVLLEFTEDLDFKIIFTGLATLMTIGPLFYLYTQSHLSKSFVLKAKYLWHFFPTALGICFGLWIDKPAAKILTMTFFWVLFAVYYVHYLIYLIMSYRAFSYQKTNLNSQTYDLLRLFSLGLLVIWFAYVLNLFDEVIPYVFGPVLYSIVAYSISYAVMRKGYLLVNDQNKYKTNALPDERVKEIFTQVQELIVDHKQFKNAELNLKSLSETIKVSPQSLSMAINKESQTNFNGFVNHHRIREAMKLLESETHENHTIASIAFEAGFNSITSFNSAFKKETGKTPKTYRDGLTK